MLKTYAILITKRPLEAYVDNNVNIFVRFFPKKLIIKLLIYLRDYPIHIMHMRYFMRIS